MDDKVKGEKPMETEMATLITRTSLPHEEQGISGGVHVRNESVKLIHRKSTDSNNHQNPSCSSDYNSFPAYHCDKCNTLITHFTNYRRHGQPFCNKCRLQKEDAMKRWAALVAVDKTRRRWKALVAVARATLVDCVEDENQSATYSVNDNLMPRSGGDHIIEMEHDVKSDSLHTKQTPDSQDTVSSNVPQAVRLALTHHLVMIEPPIKANWSWVFLKWLSRILNVLIEVCQATFAQENAEMKLSNSNFRRLCVITSLICLIISLVEIIGEGKLSKAEWRKEGFCCWFYYSGMQGRLFGKFSLYFGVSSSFVQFCINLTSLVIKKSFIKFDPLPLLLSFGHLVAAMADPGKESVVSCRIHGNCAAKCPLCEQHTPS